MTRNRHSSCVLLDFLAYELADGFDASNGLRKEAVALKEVVAELTLENRLLRKYARGAALCSVSAAALSGAGSRWIRVPIVLSGCDSRHLARYP
jgi:hypothetical protein